MVGEHPLKRFRDENGLTQEDLGRVLGVHGVTISRWETGERQIGLRSLPIVSKKTRIPACELRPDLTKFVGAA